MSSPPFYAWRENICSPQFLTVSSNPRYLNPKAASALHHPKKVRNSPLLSFAAVAEKNHSRRPVCFEWAGNLFVLRLGDSADVLGEGLAKEERNTLDGSGPGREEVAASPGLWTGDGSNVREGDIFDVDIFLTRKDSVQVLF